MNSNCGYRSERNVSAAPYGPGSLRLVFRAVRVYQKGDIHTMREEHTETTLEENRLAKTIAIANDQLQQARDAVKNRQAEMIAAQKDVRENTEFSLASLSNPDDFEALVSLSQYDMIVTNMAADYAEQKRMILRLEALIKNPYFARIDFRFEGEDAPEQIYIGRFPLTERSTHDIYIYDWRSPIAGVFYRFMTGAAFYDAPNGTIRGEVTLKRQYEIENGRLRYFFDTDLNINDKILRQLLSQNTSPKMKAIVETIQKEQDEVIRDMENDLLMVQGVAGSGKTSIALHRAAYLMYQGMQTRLPAGSILILSPNSAFEDYISDVLPELGEENVVSAVFEDILSKLLKDGRIQPYTDYLESVFTEDCYSALRKDCMSFKTSESFMKILDRYLSDLAASRMDFPDIFYHETCMVSGQELRSRVLRKPELSLGARLSQLEEYVLERIFGTARPRQEREEQARIRQALQAVTCLDIAELYGRLFQDEAYYKELTKEAERPGFLEKLRSYTLENLEGSRLYYEDALAIAYLYLKIYGTDKYRHIRQVVIDEAQDYYPLQYDMFRMLFPNAKFTVLGDINQTLAKWEDSSLYDNIRTLLSREKSALITLDKSFRCTNEILAFGLRFLSGKPDIQSFNREGDAPGTAAFPTRSALLEAIRDEIRACRDRGLGSICLMCKTESAALLLFEDLKPLTDDIRLIRSGQASELQGVFIMPAYLSKGLEFDGVIVCDASSEHYFDGEHKRLLYVECTRALHRLSLFCQGTLSPLITACGAEQPLLPAQPLSAQENRT